MSALVAAGVIVVLAMIVAVGVTLLVVRQVDGETPRRREVRRLRRDLAVARSTLTKIRHTLDVYHDQLDVVGRAFASDVRTHIREHDVQIIDQEKK